MFMNLLLTNENAKDIVSLFPKKNEGVINVIVDLKRIKAERVANGFTQGDMAKKMGWKSKSSYSKRECGRLDIGADELAKIVTILGFKKEDISYFFKDIVPV